MADEQQLNSIELAAELTIAWLGNQNVRVLPDDVPAFLKSMHSTIEQLNGSASSSPSDDAAEQSPEHVPAVSVRRSLASKDHIISMIDGKPYKTLRRHLAGHGLTPEQYRQRYNLKADYPMTSASYSEARRAMALKIGLGDKRRASRSSAQQPVAAAKKPTSQPKQDAAGPEKASKKAPAGRPKAGAAKAKSTASAVGRKPGRPRKVAAPAA